MLIKKCLILVILESTKIYNKTLGDQSNQITTEITTLKGEMETNITQLANNIGTKLNSNQYNFFTGDRFKELESQVKSTSESATNFFQQLSKQKGNIFLNF